VATVQAHAVVEAVHALCGLLVTRVGDPAVRLHEHGRAEVLLAVPPVRRTRCAAAGAENALVETVELAAVFLRLTVLTTLDWLLAGMRWEGRDVTYVLGYSVTLKVRLDGLVLLVELGQVGYEVLDDVGVRKRVDARLLLGLSGNAACRDVLARVFIIIRTVWDVHKHASVLTPSMFIAQLPQMPSLQLRLKVRVGSISFLILMSASNIIGPVLFRSRV